MPELSCDIIFDFLLARFPPFDLLRGEDNVKKQQSVHSLEIWGCPLGCSSNSDVTHIPFWCFSQSSPVPEYMQILFSNGCKRAAGERGGGLLQGCSQIANLFAKSKMQQNIFPYKMQQINMGGDELIGPKKVAPNLICIPSPFLGFPCRDVAIWMELRI